MDTRTTGKHSSWEVFTSRPEGHERKQRLPRVRNTRYRCCCSVISTLFERFDAGWLWGKLIPSQLNFPAASYRISIILNFGVEEKGQFYASPCITLIGHCIHGGISIDFPVSIFCWLNSIMQIMLVYRRSLLYSWKSSFEDGEFSGLLRGKKWRESGWIWI